MPLVEQTKAIIGNKVMLELERLDETEVEVDAETGSRLDQNQRLAIQYRSQCRKVLEAVLEAMTEDMQLNDDDASAT
jgi:hypothetical protein